MAQNDPAESTQPGAQPPLPVVWLVGKTGAGKSSLVRALTGLDGIEVGSGFRPCTRSSAVFDFPGDGPVMRFLDTRGLGETAYDPAEDLEWIEHHAHIALVVAKLTDPVQDPVIEAVRKMRRARPSLPVLLVLTGADLVDEAAAARAAAAIRKPVAAAAGGPVAEVMLSLRESEADGAGLQLLLDHLAAVLPRVALLLGRERARDDEGRRFLENRSRILRFASSAAGADMVPVIGAVGAPTVQAAMLDWLARRYGLTWSRTLMRDLAGLLGAGIAVRFGAGYALRQAVKLVPVAGQTIGAAASGALAFATTYALGRAASYYLYRTSIGASVDPEDIRRLYTEALTRARGADPD